MEQSKKAPLKFIEATAKSRDTSQLDSGLQLHLPNGIWLRIPAQVHSDLLHTVLCVAGAIPCLS